MDSSSQLISGAQRAGTQSFRAVAVRSLNGWLRLLHYATVFTIISLTMIIMGFGSIVGSLWNNDD
jgi:hypothetical protein